MGSERSGRWAGRYGSRRCRGHCRRMRRGMAWMRARSYSPSAISDRLWQFDQLSRWLDREGLPVVELTLAQCLRFAASRRAAGVVTLRAPQSMTLPYEYLRALGLTPAPPPVPHGPVEDLLADYGRYLLIERGLTPHTVRDAYVPAARLFLAGRGGPGGLRLDRLAPADVSMFLARECPQRTVSGARDLVSALRSFLRYLHLSGLIEVPLVWAVPAIADLRDRTLPRGWSRWRSRGCWPVATGADWSGGVTSRSCCCCRVWGCGRARSPGYASTTSTGVAGCCSSAARAAATTSCRCPTMSARRWCRTCGVAPRCPSRAVFVRVTAPRRELNRSTIGWVVRAACDRAGLPGVGAHRLRHTAATQMLRRGARSPRSASVSPSRAEDHRDLRQGRPHGAAAARAAVAHAGRYGMTAFGTPWLTICATAPTWVRDAPGRAPARRVRDLPRGGRRGGGSAPIWRWRGHGHRGRRTRLTWGQRLTVVRGFARHLATLDPASEVPAQDLLPGTSAAHRPLHLHR